MNADIAFHRQAATLPVTRGRPLLIVDADEVLLRFADGFDRFLRRRGLFLDFSSYRLHGNVRYAEDGKTALDIEVTGWLDEFRNELDDLDAVEHAQPALAGLRAVMDIVVLSNIVPEQAPPRLRNLAALNFDFPLLVNSGPKGPAVKALADRTGGAVFFVDDIPQHLASAARTAPEVFRIHLVGDERLRPLLPPASEAHIRAETWREADSFIRDHLQEEH